MSPRCLRSALAILIIMCVSACGGSGGAGQVQTQPPAVSDTTAPVITLAGDQNLMIEAGDVYVEPGASATDDVDGEVDVSVAGTVGDDPGIYTLTYTAEDASGNTASVTRTVEVLPPQAFTVLGSTPEQILAQLTLEQKA
ncbi:MAG: DUF5011 domain-containing protein, partial [Aequoribacter sp.]